MVCVVLVVVAAPATDLPAVLPEPPRGLWDREELLGVPGGPHDWLGSHGVDVTAWITQFPQGLLAGDGDHEWQYGGRGDLYLMADLAKLGLWQGLSLTVHGEGVYGNDVNFAGDGSLLPINTAMAFPRLVGGDSDLSSVNFTQKLPAGVSLTVLVKDEMGAEVFYDAALAGWFHLALDMQVIDPHERQLDTAVFLGLRARLVL